MARYIVTQPNGRLAIWSSITDNFILWNSTKEDVYDFYMQEAKEKFEREFPMLLNMRKFDYCVEVTKSVHGDNALPETLQLK